jgi:hypothetical protein
MMSEFHTGSGREDVLLVNAQIQRAIGLTKPTAAVDLERPAPL